MRQNGMEGQRVKQHLDMDTEVNMQRRYYAAFEPGVPEMSDDDWKKLEQSHRERNLRREKEWQQHFKEMKQQRDEEDREFKETERKIRQRKVDPWKQQEELRAQMDFYHRYGIEAASEILRVAKTLIGGNSLDGKNKRQATKLINQLLSPLTRGFFSDENWAPVNKIWKAMESAGFDFTMEKAEYQHDKDQVPISKTWHFKVVFANDKGKQMEIWGVVVAAAAGTVEDPLSKYDLVAYCS
jgi:hypothetical protein